jgi:RNA polymerase sigma-70 factor, ECF subfamily
MAAVAQQSLANPPDTARLYERHYRRVFSYCLWRLGKREDAEDAAQTTFLNAHNALSRGTTPTAEASWLLTIAHNVCLARWRSQKSRPQEQGAAPETLAAVAAPEHDPDLAPRLHAALSKLPEVQRRAFVLREWQGCSYAEIAEALDTTETAVAALVFRARRTLMQALSDERRHSRLVGGLNAGSLLGWLKSLLGGTAAKLAVAGAVVGAVGVAASVPLVHQDTPTPAKLKVVPVSRALSSGSAKAKAGPTRQRHAPAAKVPLRKHAAERLAPGRRTEAPGSTPVSPQEGAASPPAESSPPPTQAPVAASPVQVVPSLPVVNDTVSNVVGTAQQVVSQLPAITPPSLPQVPSLPTVTLPKLGP